MVKKYFILSSYTIAVLFLKLCIQKFCFSHEDEEEDSRRLLT